ncbi:uncharacterized protein LOC126379087 [Pectinophora gossypiella]|uniref:uncharacterized protein LOC126379087 n=1 Tax=Pectinophora gossypiella TaxID=13191 RepID=UPI00214F3A4C|nr:uncharacterized protein LOC126379087 [Pectinophora gossypiella]
MEQTVPIHPRREPPLAPHQAEDQKEEVPAKRETGSPERTGHSRVQGDANTCLLQGAALGCPLRLGFIALFCILLLLLLLHSRDYELLMKRVDWQTIVIFLSLGVITSVFTILTAHMDDYLWKLYGTTMTGSRRRKVHKVFAQMLSYCTVSGIANEYTMSKFFLDTVLTFSIFRGLDAVGELLGGFIMATGFWGTATILGTGANLLIAGLAVTNGYQIRFIKHIWYGVPFAFMSIILLYIYISYKYLI